MQLSITWLIKKALARTDLSSTTARKAAIAILLIFVLLVKVKKDQTG